MTDTLISRLAAALRECSDMLEQYDPGADGRAAVIRARALLAEWERRVVEERQAIETAPKDGTEIVAWTASGDAWIVSWSRTGWRIKAPPGRDPILYIDPVRWMPLPPGKTP